MIINFKIAKRFKYLYNKSWKKFKIIIKMNLKK